MRREIRSRLRSGETIEAICQEYNLTFPELVDILKYADPKPEGRPRKRPKSMLYITERCGHFQLRRNGVVYGTYRTLRDAKKVRDYFIFNRWDKRNVDKVCEKLGVERC